MTKRFSQITFSYLHQSARSKTPSVMLMFLSGISGKKWKMRIFIFFTFSKSLISLEWQCYTLYLNHTFNFRMNGWQQTWVLSPLASCGKRGVLDFCLCSCTCFLSQTNLELFSWYKRIFLFDTYSVSVTSSEFRSWAVTTSLPMWLITTTKQRLLCSAEAEADTFYSGKSWDGD